MLINNLSDVSSYESSGDEGADSLSTPTSSSRVGSTRVSSSESESDSDNEICYEATNRGRHKKDFKPKQEQHLGHSGLNSVLLFPSECEPELDTLLQIMRHVQAPHVLQGLVHKFFVLRLGSCSSHHYVPHLKSTFKSRLVDATSRSCPWPSLLATGERLQTVVMATASAAYGAIDIAKAVYADRSSIVSLNRNFYYESASAQD
ncbi:hypothetical protein C0J52_27113 [Blattella germanica]|nr:hypothetical protein C0J52_27113 [Blattella germanica]